MKKVGKTGQTEAKKKYVRVGDTVKVGIFEGKVVAADSTGRLWVNSKDGDSFIIRRRDVTEIV